MALCSHQCEIGDWYCTRERGHEGDHMAISAPTKRVLALDELRMAWLGVAPRVEPETLHRQIRLRD